MNGWDWRIASGGWTSDNETHRGRFFHAYDETDHMACEPHLGLYQSAEEPTEGSRFCPRCVVIVQRVPILTH